MPRWELEACFDRLDEDLVWRVKELTELGAELRSFGLPKWRSEMLRRAGVALLYAHWEGYVKISATAYVQFVHDQRLACNDLSVPLLALALRPELLEIGESMSPETGQAFAQLVRNGLTHQARLKANKLIHTGSNLNSKRFRRIVLSLGLDYSPYELQEKAVDSELLAVRNDIAHGKHVVPDRDRYLALQKRVLAMLSRFRDQLQEALLQRAYLAAHAA